MGFAYMGHMQHLFVHVCMIALVILCHRDGGSALADEHKTYNVMYVLVLYMYSYSLLHALENSKTSSSPGNRSRTK